MKNFLARLFIKPLTVRGPFWGVFDLAVKAVFAALWLYAMGFIISTVHYAASYEYNPRVRLWWFCYCLVVFMGASLVSYAAVFERRDY